MVYMTYVFFFQCSIRKRNTLFTNNWKKRNGFMPFISMKWNVNSLIQDLNFSSTFPGIKTLTPIYTTIIRHCCHYIYNKWKLWCIYLISPTWDIIGNINCSFVNNPNSDIFIISDEFFLLISQYITHLHTVHDLRN